MRVRVRVRVRVSAGVGRRDGGPRGCCTHSEDGVRVEHERLARFNVASAGAQAAALQQ